jgi:flagellar biosynthesis GTPase FlhF
MTTKTKEVSLPDQFLDAMTLVARVNALKVINTKEEYIAAESDYRTLITNEKKLKIQFDDLAIVKDYNRVYEQYQAMKADFAKSKKYIKDVPMRAYDDEQERIRQAEENRLAEIARKEQEAETARQVAEQKAAFEKAEKERKAAEALAAKTKDVEKKKQAEEQARQAEARAQQAREEAAAIKAEAAATPAPTVVLEKTHQGVTRRKVYKYRLTAKDGRKFLKTDLTSSVRLGISELGTLPAHLFVLSPVLLNAYVDEQGEAAAIPGVLEVKSEMV